MTFHIIIKQRPNKFGKSRADQETNLRSNGYVGMSEANFDKAKWIKKRTGYDGFLPQTVIEQTDMVDGTNSKEKK